MKKLKCDKCDFVAEGNTFEEWMMNLMPHYMQAHKEVVEASIDKSEAEQEAEKQKWMEKNKARFDAAESEAVSA